MSCVIMLVLLVIGIVWARIKKLGTFTIVDVEAPPVNDETRVFTRDIQAKQLTRLQVRCNECKHEWDATHTTFMPSIMEVGHAGLQPTQAAFLLECPAPACGFTGEVTVHKIKKFLKAKEKAKAASKTG
jgi:hypothetical protein